VGAGAAVRRAGLNLPVRLRVGAAAAGPPLFLLYFLLQAFAIVGIPPGLWPDSDSYERLSLTGGSIRLPTVPLLYKIFPTNSLREWAQVVLAAVAWWLLASVAASLVQDRRVRAGLRTVLLLLGLASPIVTWNSTILSESTAISLTALLVAALLRFQRRVDRGSTALLLVAFLFWVFTKQTHVLLGLFVAFGLVVAAVRPGRATRALRVTAAVGAIAICAAGLVETEANKVVSQRNVGAMLQMRILGNRTWTNWFVAHGMPYNREIAGYFGTPFHYQKHDRTYRIWVAWINTHGISTYEHFMITHPHYTLVEPLAYFAGEQATLTHRSTSVFGALEPDPTPSMLSPVVDYGRHRRVLPSVVDSLLFDQGEIGDVLALLLGGAALALYARRHHGRDARLTVPVLVALGSVPLGYIVWLSGGEAVGEIDRLSIVTAVLVRVGLWLVLGFSVDRALRDPVALRPPVTAPGEAPVRVHAGVGSL
jgi:hypothetical protein